MLPVYSEKKKKRSRWAYWLIGLLAPLIGAHAYFFVPFAKADGGFAGLPLTAAELPYEQIVAVDPYAPWPCPRGDAGRTGRMPVVQSAAADADLTALHLKIGDSFSLCAVTGANGLSYLCGDSGRLYALDQSGAQVFSYQMSAAPGCAPVLGDQGSLFAADENGGLYRLRATDGSLIWKLEIGGGIRDLCMTQSGALLAVTDESILLFSADGGELSSFAYSGAGGAAISADGRMFFGRASGGADCLLALDGELNTLWRRGLLAPSGGPLLTENLAVYSGLNGRVLAVFQNSGKTAWTFDAGEPLIRSALQLSGGTLIFVSNTGRIIGLSPDGALSFGCRIDDTLSRAPIADGMDRIYLAGDSGTLYCLSPDGAIRYASRLSVGRLSAPSLTKSGVIVGDAEGGVHLLPFEWPLGAKGRDDGYTLPLPGAVSYGPGPVLVAVSPEGKLSALPPPDLHPYQALTFTLLDNDAPARIVGAVSVETSGVSGKAAAMVSDDGRRLIVTPPEGGWAGADGGAIVLSLQGDYAAGGLRLGYRTIGRGAKGQFSERFALEAPARKTLGETAQTLSIPKESGDDASSWALTDFTLSYPEQIVGEGCTSSYRLGMIAGGSSTGVVFLLDAATGDRFAADLIQKGDQWSISAPSLALWLNGKRHTLKDARIWARLDAQTGLPLAPAEFSATLLCDPAASFFPPVRHLGCYCAGSGDIPITGSVTLSCAACTRAPPLADTRVQIVAGADRIMAIMPRDFADKGYMPSLLLLTNKGKIAQYDLSALSVEQDDAGRLYASLPYLQTAEKVRALLLLNTYPAAEQLILPHAEEE